MKDRSSWLAGKHVLVVENEWLIADDLIRSLVLDGARVVGPAASVDQAVKLIRKTSRIDAAVLDVHLGDASDVYVVAQLLRARRVPFLFATGYDGSRIRGDFAGVPHLTKPYAPASVGDALATILAPNPRLTRCIVAGAGRPDRQQ